MRTIFEAANKGQRPALPTFSLALAAFDDAHWSAMLPGRPLRHWHLIEVLSGDALTTSPLRIDERILHYLTGMHAMDERVRGVVDGVAPAVTLTPSELAVAQRIVDCLSPRNRQESRPVVQLCGSEPESRRAVAAQACALLGLGLHVLNVQAVPRGGRGDRPVHPALGARDGASTQLPAAGIRRRVQHWTPRANLRSSG